MGLIVNGREIVLSGFVGGDAAGDGFWEPEGFSSTDIVNALAQVGRGDVTIRLNSAGGIAVEGAAIHAALAQHKGNVRIIVEGVAASAASLLAMAADEIVMSLGSIMMIHDPASVTFGNADEHLKKVEALNTLGDAYAGIYAERSGKTLEEARALMRAETWMTGPEAVAAGFADSIDATNDNEVEPTAFAYGIYARAPERLVALAHARGWKARASLAAPAAPHRQPEKPTMTTQNPAGPAPEQTIENHPAPAAEPTPAPAADPAAEAVARAADIATLCAEGGVASLAGDLIRSGATVDEARARVAQAGEIRAAVAQAGRIAPAITAAVGDEMIRAGMTVEQARAALLDRVVAAQSAEIAPSAPPTADSSRAVMDKVVAKLNARVTGQSA